jgi:hypothetical protein
MTSCPLSASEALVPTLLLASPFVGALGATLVHFVLPRARALVARTVATNPPALEWIQEVTVHGAFYGLAMATLLGLFECGSIAGTFATLLISATCLACALFCAIQRHTLQSPIP